MSLAIILLQIQGIHSYSSNLRLPYNQRRYRTQSLNPIDRTNFDNLSCRGMYQQSYFSQLDGVCNDCYLLYKEPDIHAMCRSNCFRSDVFFQCVEALMLTDKLDNYRHMAQALGKKKK